MNITIKNHITLGNDTELIHEVYEGELTTKGAYHYLIYTNDEKEKVVLKYNAQELIMTRFSKPQSVMRFAAGKLAQCSVPTPMGLQQLVTRTSYLSLSGNQLQLGYDLLPHLDAEEVFASYRMSISWEE